MAASIMRTLRWSGSWTLISDVCRALDDDESSAMPASLALLTRFLMPFSSGNGWRRSRALSGLLHKGYKLPFLANKNFSFHLW